ncbi:MAG: preprotein translocase subunit SecY [Defluviitaleaceae bacterium]|nr:preprotein translocase subunit SecY [Defluviitaleaceae bacterium]MCL2262702.1 preprotein translocase subunit SecY [Defluviitaleaceae bacterium]
MFKIFANAWRVEDIRKKILFILLLLFIYRVGAILVPLPGIDLEALAYFRDPTQGMGDAAMTFFSLLMGGELGTVFAMGIAPYITASIIMQLLTYAIPALSQMQKEDEEGRKKIQQITRYLAVALAALQAAGMVFSYTRFGAHMGLSENLFAHQNIFVYIVATVAMMTGTIFIMWLAELLTEKGIGNGASFLIFANILAGLPAGVMTFWSMLTADPDLLSVVLVAVLLIAFVLIIAFVVLVHEGERRIPVQYSRKAAAGSGFKGPQQYIPLKVNIAGVLSIIFAMSLIGFPVQIAQFFPNATFVNNVARFVDFTRPGGMHPVGIVLYIVLIFAFTHFYTSFAVNPIEMAEGLKKNGGFIPGIRPGKPTSDFIQITVNRLSWIGSVFYSLIAITPILMGLLVPQMAHIAFGGTSLLIVTGVALEFVKQLESQLLMRHYKGFLE